MAQANKKSGPPANGPRLKYGNQAFGTALVLVALLAAASLLVPARLGSLGAWLHGALLEILGLAAFALPAFFVVWAIYQFRRGLPLSRLLRLIVLLWAIFFAAAFLSLTEGGGDAEALARAVERGGAVGLLLRSIAIGAVGQWLGLILVGIVVVVAAAWSLVGVTPWGLWNAAATGAHKIGKSVQPSWAGGVDDEEEDAWEEEESRATAPVKEKDVGGGEVTPPRVEEKPRTAAPTFTPPAAAPAAGKRGQYRLPPLDLLTPPSPPVEEVSQDYLNEMKRRLEAAMQSYRVAGRVREIRRGPRVSRFEVELSPGQKFGALKSLEEDLARSVAVQGITITSLASRGAVGVDIPNPVSAIVGLRELLGTNTFKKELKGSKLTVAIGRRHDGQIVAADFAKMPHLLVAGTTGSGKSIFLNGVIMSLLMTSTPDEVQFLIIDPKRVDFKVFGGIPHRHFAEVVIAELDEAVAALRAVVHLMEDRYKLLAAVGARNIDAYNRLFESDDGRRQLGRIALTEGAEVGRPLPYVMVVVDELNDLMTREKARKVEENLVRLAQMARAVGIHLVIATQRPSVDVITGVIKANFPSRAAFKLSSQVDSRTILDRAGAEHLLPEGDMLFCPAGASEPERIQGVYVGDDEIARVVGFWREQPLPEGRASIRETGVENTGAEAPGGDGNADDLYDDAVAFVVSAQTASASMLQRRFRIGFARAGRLLDIMEQNAVVGPGDGSKPRKVLIKTLDRIKKADHAATDAEGF